MSPSSAVDIEAILWKTYNLVRGRLNLWEWREGLALFFLKFLMDAPNEAPAIFFPNSCDFSSLYRSCSEPKLGSRIQECLLEIEKHNPSLLAGVLCSSGGSRTEDEQFRALLEMLSQLDLKSSNGKYIAGNAFELLLAHLADVDRLVGSFYTPPNVATLLTRLVDLQPGDRVCDPSCGSGSLLLEAWRQAGGHGLSLSGQEVNPDSFALCKMNLLLHGIEARIELGDVLASPHLLVSSRLMTFDVVLTNPPFGRKNREISHGIDPWNRFHRGIPPRHSADYAFLSHAIETLHEGGRGAILAPPGVLFRGGSEGLIRRRLLEENLVQAVIALPPNLFFGTGIPATVLVLHKGSSRKDVLFIDASQGYAKLRSQNYLRQEDIENITEAFQSFESIPGFAHRATFEQIAEQDFNLNVTRYLSPPVEARVSMEKLQTEIQALEDQLAATRRDLDDCVRTLGFDPGARPHE